ncbi:MAG TPA: hydroxyacid dehydrogenase [Blastocatellia bacterium]
MPEVLITENIIGEEMDKLRERFDSVFEPNLWKEPDKLREIIPNFRALIARNQTQITRDIIEAGTRLEVIARAGVGMDNVDLAAASRAGIVVAWTPEQNSNSVAELTIGLMLSLARMIPDADVDTKKGGWNRWKYIGVELLGKTLGIVGLGRIGSLTAAKARALGMEILAYDPYVDPESLRAMEVRARLTSLEEVLALSDFVSLHVPETDETRGMFGDEQFGQMKPGAYFINAARGGVVKEDALLRALSENRIAGAALDVRQQEPAVPSAFDEMTNVILIPHIGAQTREAQRRVVTAVARDVTAILNGEEAKHFANFSRPRKSRL